MRMFLRKSAAKSAESMLSGKLCCIFRLASICVLFDLLRELPVCKCCCCLPCNHFSIWTWVVEEIALRKLIKNFYISWEWTQLFWYTTRLQIRSNTKFSIWSDFRLIYWIFEAGYLSGVQPDTYPGIRPVQQQCRISGQYDIQSI